MWLIGFLMQKAAGLGIAYYLYTDLSIHTDTVDDVSHYVEIRVSILEGRNLVAKDKNIWGKRVTSDPYVKVYHGPNKLGKTGIVKKTLDPKWDPASANFSIYVVPMALDVYHNIECNIFDHDQLSADDPMGTCYVTIPSVLNKKISGWYAVEKGEGHTYCRNATGELKVEVEVRSKLGNIFQNKIKSTVSHKSDADYLDY
jgi:Ca2+-dependent lipid-binding protein